MQIILSSNFLIVTDALVGPKSMYDTATNVLGSLHEPGKDTAPESHMYIYHFKIWAIPCLYNKDIHELVQVHTLVRNFPITSIDWFVHSYNLIIPTAGVGHGTSHDPCLAMNSLQRKTRLHGSIFMLLFLVYLINAYSHIAHLTDN